MEYMVLLKNVTVLKASFFSPGNHESLRCLLSVFILVGQSKTSLAALFWAICSFLSSLLDADDQTGEQ